jgi:hypothetical protein
MISFEQSPSSSESGTCTAAGTARSNRRSRKFRNQADGSRIMLWTIAVILLILWVLGFAINIGGGLIHILLVLALIVGLIQLFTGRRVV